MKTPYKNKICVITGGSSGIGYSIAEQLAEQGAQLLLIARDAQKLDTAANALRQRGAERVEALSADITQATDIAKIAPAIAALGPAADLVVNSAGIVSAGLLEEVPQSEWQRLFGINVFALVDVLQAVLPAMRQRAEEQGVGGQIVNIASAAGLVGFPGMAAYGATKSAVLALGESLRAELAGLKIGVTTVCPGFVQTPIAQKVTLFGRMDHPKVRRNVESGFTRNNLQPETVARTALRGALKNQALVVVGRDARSGYWTKRVAPLLLQKITAKAAGMTTHRRPQTA